MRLGAFGISNRELKVAEMADPVLKQKLEVASQIEN